MIVKRIEKWAIRMALSILVKSWFSFSISWQHPNPSNPGELMTILKAPPSFDFLPSLVVQSSVLLPIDLSTLGIKRQTTLCHVKNFSILPVRFRKKCHWFLAGNTCIQRREWSQDHNISCNTRHLCCSCIFWIIVLARRWDRLELHKACGLLFRPEWIH